MATSIAAPNVERLTLPDIDFAYESNGIISLIDEVVERVMKKHMKRAPIAIQDSVMEEELVPLPRPTLYYTFSPESSSAEAAA